MNHLRFDWDENKNLSNIKKHGISFCEASSVFYDEDAVLFNDPDNSGQEDRFLIIGFSQRMRLVIVSHCYRCDDEVIRIISARKATKRESKSYTIRKGDWY